MAKHREPNLDQRSELSSVFPTGDWLAPSVRHAYFGAVVCACVLLTGGVIVILIDTLTSSALSSWWKAMTSLCAVGVAAHLLVHIRRAGPFTRRTLDRASWVIFVLCSVELVISCWLSVKDPIGRAVVTGMIALGAWSSAFATLILGSVGRRLAMYPPWLRWLAALIAWAPGIGLIVLFLV